ncbi:UDP-N-acetylglucosamine 4,6-dehydratase (inverting) [Hydrogenophaga sp.]|uniref:UDP-N-acetylglucosamine 4,6-dehydratase (inverting) n=1 Tax=Hydrogenophaga sp. TaxID=1904254 RepID=UPI002735DA27|nr:UDP-N-acetylglucosamine 4,6-dehydratase (inverting) [Hydrogenophaga sp.]MDP3884876.1 UDP-N-acetylglucosamine 4,6-dehydratase (inverting) [Hydrogenophaga sp.]
MKSKNILITGGTGSFGTAFVGYLLEHHPDIARIVVFSRDEQKHVEMARRFPPSKYPLRYMVGDIRDRERMMEACRNMDIVVHAAAMKHVPVAEENPMECAKTNILGVQNVIDAALANKVSQVIALSSDKAVAPANVYGASKLFLEKLFLNANRENATQFSVVRYANVFGSKGSVVPFFLEKMAEGYLPITHPEMTRFSISMQEGLDLVMFAIQHGKGGEVIVPKAPSYRILDVATAIAPGVEHRIVGIRPGEKLHEMMVGASEAAQTVELGCYYIVCPSEGPWDKAQYCSENNATPVAEAFEFESGRNTEWMTVETIRGLIKQITQTHG